MTPKRIILIDADVVSHFVTAGEELIINQVFPNNPIFILDKAHAELQQWPSNRIRTQISLLLSKKIIRLMDFPEDDEIIKKEYYWIKTMQLRGDGESACLAVARYNKNILASSNLKDIKNYCIMHTIDYLTTMDFLCAGLASGLFTKQRCNDFITKVLYARSKLPVSKMDDYKCRAMNFVN